ncbi:MAG: hypothetical protein IJL14_02600, partial [Selenomonadaceae bacterium]|nr:hypothetical protein [Selenomonadaceae bacterium]
RQRYRKNFWSQALDDLQKLSELSENIVRLNNYKAAKNKLAAQRADGKTTITDKQLAALESRKASVDFSQSGRSMRELNRVFLFSNAAIRGLDLWRETLTPL